MRRRSARSTSSDRPRRGRAPHGSPVDGPDRRGIARAASASGWYRSARTTAPRPRRIAVGHSAKRFLRHPRAGSRPGCQAARLRQDVARQEDGVSRPQEGRSIGTSTGRSSGRSPFVGSSRTTRFGPVEEGDRQREPLAHHVEKTHRPAPGHSRQPTRVERIRRPCGSHVRREPMGGPEPPRDGLKARGTDRAPGRSNQRADPWRVPARPGMTVFAEDPRVPRVRQGSPKDRIVVVVPAPFGKRKQ